MDTIKGAVFTALSTVSGASVMLAGANKFSSFPAITYFVSFNENTHNLDNELVKQDTEVTVDIYAEGSTSILMASAELALRNIGYRMVYMADVPALSSDVGSTGTNELQHTNLRFTAVLT